MAKTGSAYLLHNRRMPEEMGSSPANLEVDDATLKEVHEKLESVLKLPNYPYQSKQEYAVFNLNPRDADSVKNYVYYHEGRLSDDEYDEKKLFVSKYKPMLVVFRDPDGTKHYIDIERASDAYDVPQKLRAQLLGSKAK